MSYFGVRNLDGFNKLIAESVKKGTPLLEPEDLQSDGQRKELGQEPKIVLIIDELADLMMVVGKS